MFGKKKRAVLKSRPITRDEAKPVRVAGGSRESTVDAYLAKLTPEAKVELKRQAKELKEIRDFAQKSPEEVGELIKYWLSIDD